MKLAFAVVAVALFGAGLVTLNGLSSSVQLAGTRQSDTRITSVVRSALVAGHGLEARQVDIETGSGVVRLTGWVASEASRQEIVRVARDTAGVRGVTDDLAIGQDSPDRRFGNESIRAQIQALLSVGTGIAAGDIDVRSSRGVVRLIGIVGSEATRREAVRIAHAAPGVTEVVNELLVDRTGPRAR